MEYDFNETMAASAEVYPIDANGNEVFNVPGVAGSQTDPRYNQQPTIQGYATTVEMQLLRTEIDRLSQELAQLRMELASVRQQPAYPVAA